MQGAVRHEARGVQAGLAAPDEAHGPDDQDEYAERGHERFGGARLSRPHGPEHQPVEGEAEEGAPAAENDERGQPDRPVPPLDELPHEIGRKYGDGTEREVEDAGGTVGDEQTEAGEGGNRSDAEPGKGEVEGDVHGPARQTGQGSNAWAALGATVVTALPAASGQSARCTRVPPSTVTWAPESGPPAPSPCGVASVSRA